jgi:hypothetical protein
VNLTESIGRLISDGSFAERIEGVLLVFVVTVEVHFLTSLRAGRQVVVSLFTPYWFSKCPFWPFFRKFLKNIFLRLMLRSFRPVRVDVPSRTKGGGERQPTAKKCRERQKAPTQS